MKMLTGNQRYAVSIFVTILIVLGVYSTGYADITPMSDRTPQVAEVILNVVKLDYPSVSSFAEITATHLAAPTTLYLNNRNITALESGDFDGLTGLTELRLNNNQLVSLPEGIFDGLTALGNLNLYNNQLSSLPDGIFEGLTSLTTIRLGRNTVDPFLLTVSLEKVAGGQFKAVAPTGTTFDFVLPISVTNGSITGGASSVTILQGSVESETFTVTRTTGTTTDVTVDIGTLPSLPRNHYGYALVKSDDLPLAVITSINTAPIFTDGTAFTRTVAENTAAAVNIGTVITATDTENDTLTYTLSGNPDASAFDIDSSTGQLKTKAALDYETKNVYTVTITVSDGSLTDTIAVTINVTDVDEVPTIGTPDQPPTTPTPVQINIAPEFVEGDSTTRVVLENTPAGVNIGTPMSVSDSLGDLLAYTLGGVDADSFDIDSGGQLKAKVPLDYETKRVYLVTITVDDEELFDTITVIIYVIDVNDTVIVSGFVPVADRTPQVRDAIVAAIPGVTDAAQVTAAQLATITNLNLRDKSISLLKTGDFFGLTALTNLNLFSNQLSSLPSSIFDGLTALTTLRLGGNAVDPLPLIVSLQSVGEGEFKAVITTGAPFNIVLPITVTNGSITGGASSVTILQGSVESETFTVTRTTGTTTDVTVDIGTLPSLPRNHYGYALVKSDDLPLTVITSINTAPIFTDGTAFTRTVAENTAAAVNIGTVITATDTENDTLTYTLSGNPDASAFDIDSSTGQLKTKAALDYETKNVYTVTITVSDGSLTDTIAVTINVTDVDEVPTIGTPDQPPTTPTPVQINIAPEFVEGDSTTRVVLENTPAGVNIGTPMSVSDSLGDLLAYTLSGVDADSFDIDSGGQLKAKVPLDYETKRVYLVTITVDDEELFDTITVIIYVIDVNDTVIVSGFVPVADRTPQVRDAIVAAIPGVTDAAQVTAAQLATITNLNLRDKSISLLKTGDFFGLTALTNLNLFSNQFSSLPSSIFDGLTALTTLRLGGNAVDPLPLIVSLQSVGEGEFKAVITTGAPFSIVLPINVTNGSISGGTISVMIPQGSAESASFTVIGTSAKVSFRYLPGLPSNHYGYTLAQSTVCNRTEAVADAIAKAVGVTDCSALTEVDLATITMLDLSDMSIASLNSGDFDGMLSLRSLYLGNNELTGLPSGIFDDLVSLRELFLNSNKLTTLSGGIFSNLTSLTNLYLQGNDLSSLSSSVFDGLSSLKHLGLEDNELTSLSGSIFVGIPNVSSILLSKNKLTSLPAGIFEGLSSLSQLHLSVNSVEPLPLVVSLQKVGTNQFKAVVPIGAPFAMTLPVTVQNGTIAGGTTTITIPIGRVESQPVTVTRTPGAVNAVTANIGNQLPRRPATHNGYVLVKSTTLSIEVIPPLNSPPVFTEGATTTDTIAENTAAGTNIGDAVIATDVNTGDTLTYTLGGTDAAAFDIDSATGQLKTKAALDYETQNAYSIVLTVSDGRVTDTITVTINISNVNEAPVFAVSSSTTHTVAENTAAGENIGSPMSATDDDSDTLSYSLSGTDAGKFSIDSTNGQLRTNAPLDYETKTSYTVTITASDSTDSTTITVTINVINKTENRAPVFSEGSSATRSVAENTGSGVDIGSVVAATDDDGDTLSYSLSGTDASSFSIDSTIGQLKTGAALNFEDKSSYTFTITVSDETLTDTITVTINVTDANDAPIFTDGESTSRSVAENTATGNNIGSVVAATDADNDTLTYSLGGTDAASFGIVGTSGQLQTSAALDYETKSSYTVTVSVSDGKGGTDSITVTINVTDVSEVTNNVPVSEVTNNVL